MNDSNSIPETPFIGTGEAGRMYGFGSDTILDWMKDGINTPAGRVRLKFKKLGGRYKTTAAWLEEFFAACAGDDGDVRPVTETPAAEQRRRERDKRDARKALQCKNPLTPEQLERRNRTREENEAKRKKVRE